VSAERAVELLKATGMSGYEAKAYVALVRAARPLNGYEVAKASGVPRSTVYETLGKLVARGAAFEVKDVENGTGYLALPAETLVVRLRQMLADTIDGLTEALAALAAPAETHLVQHVRGDEHVLARAVDVVDAARQSLFCSIWPPELEVLLPALRRAAERGVDVSCISFGPVDPDLGELGHVYEHRFSSPEIVAARMGCRVFTVVGDRDAVLIGAVDEAGTWGMWSDDPAVVLVAGEYVRHDIALQVIVGRAGASDLQRIWESDADLEHLRATTWVATERRPG